MNLGELIHPRAMIGRGLFSAREGQINLERSQ